MQALILQNRSNVFFDSLPVKTDSDLSLFHPGIALKSSNESEDLKYVSVERNRTQLVSTTTVSPINAAVTERIDQIISNLTTTTPKRSQPLIEFTKSKSRVNIKPSRSGWLAIRVDHSLRYFGRARKRKGGPKMDLTPTTTSSEDIRLVAREQRVVKNLNAKNRTQSESSNVALLKAVVHNSNDSQRAAVVTQGKSDVRSIIADVTDIPQLIWYKPTTEPSSQRLRLGTKLDCISSNSRSINPANTLGKSDVKAIIADVTDIPQLIWYKPTTEPSSQRLRLGTKLDSISSNSRSVNPANTLGKSDVKAIIADVTDIPQLIWYKPTTELSSQRLRLGTKLDSISSNSRSINPANTLGKSDVKAIIADVTDIPQLIWYKPTTELSSQRLRLGTKLDSISSNSRSINPANNHAKSMHVFEEDTQLEKADARKETSSIDNNRKEEKEGTFNDFWLKTTSSYGINDTNIIESSGEVFTNIRRPFVAIFRQKVSLTENNIKSSSAQEALSNITNTLIDFRIDVKNQSMTDGSADFDLNHTLINLSNDQLSYNSLDYTDYPETTNLLEAEVSPTVSSILPTPVTRPPEMMTTIDSYKHANDSVASNKSTKILFKLITNASSDSPTRRLKNSMNVTDSMLSPTLSITTSDRPSKTAIFSTFSNVERKYTDTVLPFTEPTGDRRNNHRQTNIIDNVEISGDIISTADDPSNEAYNLTSNDYNSNDNRQSETETLSKQQTFAVSLTDESQNPPNTATSKSFISSISKQTANFKNLILNINSDDSMTSVSGKLKANSRNMLSGHETTTAASVSRTTTLLRLFLLEGKTFTNSSLKTQALTEEVLNRSSGVPSKMEALTSPKKLASNRTKDSFGVTVIINIKSAGSGWVKIPINKTSPSKGVEIDVHRTSTTSTASKPFTNTSTANTLLEPSLDPEATLISSDIAHWESITPALNINPVTAENPDTIKHMLIPTPASQTALTNASVAATKGLHLVNSYFQASDAPAFNTPTSVTGTKRNGISTEETSTMKRDFTSTVGTESTSKLQTDWPVSTTELGEKETVNRIIYGLSTKQATKTLAKGTTTKATTLLSTSATFFTPSITTIPTSVTMSSLPLTTTFPTTTTLPSTTLPSTTTSETTLASTTTLPSTTSQTLPSTTLPPTTPQTTLPSTTLPLTTTTQTTLPSTTLPPTTTSQTTLPSTTLPSTTTAQTTLPSTTLPSTTTTQTTLPSTTLPPTISAKTLPLTTSSSPTSTTTTPLTTNAPPLTTTSTLQPPSSSSSSSSSSTFSFTATLPLTTKITTLPMSTTTQLTNPLLTTTIPPPPTTSTLPPTTITATTSTTTVPKTTFPKTSTILTTRPLTTQISTFSPTSSSTTAASPTQKTIAKSITTITPSQTPMPITSTAIKRLPGNTPLTSSSTIITAQSTSGTVTFAPVAFSSPVDPTHTTPALTTTTTNPTTTEITGKS
ncbi:unnamed protein product [Acanthosepion pharaonis]|uniref:Uncharacterized protein n=1 Tax=Acanthosepion pharaonis TaxID=158019 RepID=A0A812CPR5_ACAPH|nr:unnamed protein product [Sepia pharaonis]